MTFRWARALREWRSLGVLMENVKIWLAAMSGVLPETLAAIDAHPFAAVIIAVCVVGSRWNNKKT